MSTPASQGPGRGQAPSRKWIRDNQEAGDLMGDVMKRVWLVVGAGVLVVALVIVAAWLISN